MDQKSCGNSCNSSFILKVEESGFCQGLFDGAWVLKCTPYKKSYCVVNVQAQLYIMEIDGLMKA